MKLARPKPVPPRKGRPAALGASPSQIAKQYERGAECRGSRPACAGLDGNEERQPLADAPRREATQRVFIQYGGAVSQDMSRLRISLIHS